jgi:acetyl esterase/lipase
VLVHGGCWTKEFGGITQLRSMAGALASRGIASWNVEYRRVDEAGGGYPGTYQDMNAAMAVLGQTAQRYPLDLDRLVAVGHSAGGQLVQWLGARSRIAPSSPLYSSTSGRAAGDRAEVVTCGARKT